MEKRLYKRIRGVVSNNFCEDCSLELDKIGSDTVFELSSGNCSFCNYEKRDILEGVEIRKVYKLKKSSKEDIFCEKCLLEIDENSKNCLSLPSGTCFRCGYERDDRVVFAENLKIVRWSIEEVERVIKNIKETDRTVRIDTIIFEREKSSSTFENISDPLFIKNRLHIPPIVKKRIILQILKEQIVELKKEEKELLGKIKNPA